MCVELFLSSVLAYVPLSLQTCNYITVVFQSWRSAPPVFTCHVSPMMNHKIVDCEVEELGHTSEIGLRVYAPSLADLFRCLAGAMIALTGVEAEQEEELGILRS